MKNLLRAACGGLAIVVAGLIFYPALVKNKEAVPRVSSEMEAIITALGQFRQNFGSYPTGTWRDVSQSLMGENRDSRIFIEGDRWTNVNGELIDPWGTPFAVANGTNLVLKSAGPNRIFGDRDDVVSTITLSHE